MKRLVLDDCHRSSLRRLVYRSQHKYAPDTAIIVHSCQTKAFQGTLFS